MFSDKEIYEVTKMLDKFLRIYEKCIESIAQEFPGTLEEVIEMILINGLKKIQRDIDMVENLWMKEQEKIAELKDKINSIIPKKEEQQ